jgi:Zn-dependent oligopeptidase
MAYIQNQVKKEKYAIDEQQFAEYFPMEKTINGLIAVYEQFFSLVITHVDPGITWHQDVQLLQISDKQNNVLGYVYLDMFPRLNKYGHAAQFGGVKALKRGNVRYPAVVTLVCNFTKPVGDTPSLLKYNEVVTFFHECGHALHSVLGATYYGMQAGTSTERDFVELPSQMLENWMEEAAILKMVSSHYKTGQPLPDDLIEKRLTLLRSETGMFVSRQLSLGMICLDMFDDAPTKDTSACMKKYSVMMSPYKEYSDTGHTQCSFGHLMGYGASYYGYMWALVRGTDVFAQIKKEGLLNPIAGKRYVDAIIGRGGSVDGNTMVKDYLGREATYDAFYEKMGF